MWLATTCGFFSIVSKDKGLHIRARYRKDLQNLQKLVPSLPAPVRSYEGSDYPWRILTPVKTLPAVMVALAGQVDYGNFKDKIKHTPGQRDKLHAYYEIWESMFRWSLLDGEKPLE